MLRYLPTFSPRQPSLTKRRPRQWWPIHLPHARYKLSDIDALLSTTNLNDLRHLRRLQTQNWWCSTIPWQGTWCYISFFYCLINDDMMMMRAHDHTHRRTITARNVTLQLLTLSEPYNQRLHRHDHCQYRFGVDYELLSITNCYPQLCHFFSCFPW